jgi:uncharacterized repeat protein (TIGR01451 family)
MAVDPINEFIKNFATITYKGADIDSNTVTLNIKDVPPTLVKSTTFATEPTTGDVIPWKIVIKNNNPFAITMIAFSDVLDLNTVYLAGSFKVNGTTQTPTATSPAVTYTIPAIVPSGTATVEFSVTVL